MSDPETQELPVVPPLGRDEPLITAEGDDEDWLTPPPTRGIRLKLVTFVLLVAVAGAGAFWAGTVVQKHNGSTSTSGSAAALLGRLRSASAAAGAGGAGGGGGFGAAGRSTPAASGTLTDVTGTTLYLTDSSGSLIKVVLTPSTTVTRTGIGQPGTLSIGDTITVQGTKGAGGTVTATRVVATAQGVSGAGFGGAAGGQGGGASRPTGSSTGG